MDRRPKRSAFGEITLEPIIEPKPRSPVGRPPPSAASVAPRRCGAGRQAVELEGEALRPAPAPARDSDRLRQRQRPVRASDLRRTASTAWPAGAATSTTMRGLPAPASRRTARIASAAVRADLGRAWARAPRPRRALHPARSAPPVSASSALAFGRHAKLLAHRIVELEAQRDRLAGVLARPRAAGKRRRPCSRSSCRRRRREIAAAPGTSTVTRLDVVRRRRNRTRRHAGIAGIAPVGLPAGLEPDFDAGAERAAACFVAGLRGNQPRGRAAGRRPRATHRPQLWARRRQADEGGNGGDTRTSGRCGGANSWRSI